MHEKEIEKLEKRNKMLTIALIISVTIIFAIVIQPAVYKWNNPEVDTVLFSGISQEEAIEIFEELRKMGITPSAYVGGNIMIPAKYAQKAREQFEVREEQ